MCNPSFVGRLSYSSCVRKNIFGLSCTGSWFEPIVVSLNGLPFLANDSASYATSLY